MIKIVYIMLVFVIKAQELHMDIINLALGKNII